MKRKSFFSTRFVWLAFGPIIVVSSVVGFCVGLQLTAAMSIRNRIAELRDEGLPYDELSLTKHFFDSSSQENSRAWFEVRNPILNVTGAGTVARVPSLPRQYRTDELTAIDHPDEPQFGRQLEQVLLKNAQPVLEQLRQLTKTPATAWIPIVIDHRREFGIGSDLAPFGIIEVATSLPALEFSVAARESEYDRAIQALKVESGCLTAFDWCSSIAGDAYRLQLLTNQYQRIRETLSDGSWTEKHLQELSEVVGSMPDFPSRWRSVVVAERAMVLGELNADEMWLGSELEVYGARSRGTLKTVSIPATRLKSFIDALDQFVEIGDGGCEGLAARAHRSFLFAMQEYVYLPQIIGLLFNGPPWEAKLAEICPNIGSYAHSLKETEAQRRLTATAIAIYRYRHANDKWPKALDGLREVGLSPQDWTAVDEGPFEYKVDVDADTVVINQETFSWQTEIK